MKMLQCCPTTTDAEFFNLEEQEQVKLLVKLLGLGQGLGQVILPAWPLCWAPRTPQQPVHQYGGGAADGARQDVGPTNSCQL
jgi:hypothetical protein